VVKTMNPEISLTDVMSRRGLVVVVNDLRGASSSNNGRRIPYAEQYRQSSGIRETPIQQLQRAADDEAAREASD
jgi:hypothetical protein